MAAVLWVRFNQLILPWLQQKTASSGPEKASSALPLNSVSHSLNGWFLPTGPLNC